MKKIWLRTIQYTLLTTIIAASVSCVLYIFIQPSIMTETSSTQYTMQTSGYFTHLSSLIPSNIFSPFINQQVISVLLLSFLFGFSIKHIPEENSKKTVIRFVRGVHALFLVITRWIVMIIPLGVFGFITTTMIQLRDGMSFKGIGQYLLVIVLANLIQGLIILPLWLYSKGVNPIKAFFKMMPALSFAFFSKSSVACIPVTMNSLEKSLGVDTKISRFVIPLCTSINMNGCAAFIFTTVVYLMQNHGLHLSHYDMLLWILIATIAAVGNAGVPMGCFFLSASLLVSMDVPIVLMGIILPFYSLIDMLETSLNVWSDSCVTKIVNDELAPVTKDSLITDPYLPPNNISQTE